MQLKEKRRQQRLRGHTSYNVENGEFLCPLCECLSNTVIPLLPHTETPDHRYTHTHLPDHRYISMAGNTTILKFRIVFNRNLYNPPTNTH